MATKTERWETRVDPETDRLAADAANRQGISKSAFIASATRAEAERILARADTTLMSETAFAEIIASLDTGDQAPALERLASTARPYRRA